MPKIILVILVALGAVFSFIGLNWDQGFFLNWDERQIGWSAAQIKWPHQLNPHFFKYGSFPIYLISIIGHILNLATKTTDWTTWQNGVYIGRFLSASLAILLILLTYKITRTLIGSKDSFTLSPASWRGKWAPLLAAFLTATSVGLIQHAHFATFQIFLTFESLLLFYLCLKLMKPSPDSFTSLISFIPRSPAMQDVVGPIIPISLITGLSLATKINNFALLPIPILAILLCRTPIKQKLFYLFLFFIFSFLFLFLAAPYNFLDFSSFSATIKDEMNIAAGRPIFYNDQFIGSIPILFQFTKIFPFILNPLLTIFLIPSILWLFLQSSKLHLPSSISHPHPPFSILHLHPPSFLAPSEVRQLANEVGLFLTSSLLLFTPAFFFSKWTRHLIPLLPFLYITISLFITEIINLLEKRSLNQKLKKYLILNTKYLMLLFSLFYALAFFNVYLKPHTAIQTASWMSQNLPKDAKILTEDLDVTVDPIKTNFPNVTLFDFYALDNKIPPQTTLEELNRQLKENDYFLILSRKVYQNRLAHPDLFPNAANFYNQLFNNQLNFQEIYRSENPFSLLGIKIDDNYSEESFQVYDHPQLILFKKILQPKADTL